MPESEIIELLSLKKLDQLKISIYGHDADSFKKLLNQTVIKIINLNFLMKNLDK